MTNENPAAVRQWTWCALFAGVASLSVALGYAWCMVFSRTLSLDEGYLMITVRGFLEGNPLYDSVFTQYGPFYYAYEGVLHGLGRIPLTHDATRLLCIFHWIAAAMVMGWAARVLAGSVWFGIFVFMQGVVHLAPVANEPGHPQEVIALLLSLGALLASRTGPKGPCVWGLVIVSALLALIKINVGILFGIPLFVTLLMLRGGRFSTESWSGIMTSVCVTLPFILMRRHVSMAWCFTYCIVTASGITGGMVAAMRAARERKAGEEMGWVSWARLAVVFMAPLGLFLGMAAWRGSSLRGLLDGLLLIPLRTPDVALLPVDFTLVIRGLKGALVVLPGAVLASAILGLLTALLHGAFAEKFREKRVLIGLKLFFGLAGTFLLVSEARLQLGLLLPWSWLMLAPDERDQSQPRFARIFLCMLAVFQALQAYPIGGTQVTIATWPLILGCALCLLDATQMLSKTKLYAMAIDKGVTGEGRRLLPLMGGVALVFLFCNRWCELPALRREFASLPHLGLPGAKWVRTNPDTVELYQSVSHYLETESDAFSAYPGVNSLYFWAKKAPPTQFNCTGWGLLSVAQQEAIFAALGRAKHPRFLLLSPMPAAWKNAPPPPIAPLVHFVNEQCREIKKIGSFTILGLQGKD